MSSIIALTFLAALLVRPWVKALLPDAHFFLDGTLIEAWADMKSFRSKDDSGDGDPLAGRNAERDFRGEKRLNDTHASVTDPDAQLYKKAAGQAAKLCFIGHVLMENRSSLVVDARLTHAPGTAEREAALDMPAGVPGRHKITFGADKAYDVGDFVARTWKLTVSPHVAQDTSNRRSAIDGRTIGRPGHWMSQTIRKRIEEILVWSKSVPPLSKGGHRGLARVGWQFSLTTTAYNPIRLPKLLSAAA